MTRPAKPDRCELCERPKVLSFHHLIPRRNHRHRAFQTRYDRAEMNGRGLWLCALCHRMLHRSFDERRLGLELNTREALLAEPQVQRFLAWAKKQK